MTELALNPFKKGKKTEVEGVRKVSIESNPWLEEVLEQYNSIPSQRNQFTTIYSLRYLEKIILPTEKINYFLQYILSNNLIKGSKTSDADITGAYITKLIQDSFDQENNNFVLHTHDYWIDLLAYKIEGIKDKKINMVIEGNVGDSFGYGSKYCKFVINNDADEGFGCNSNHSTFSIKGNVSIFCGLDSIDCIYQTPNKNTYEDLSRIVSKSNKIQLLDANGEVLKEVRK